MINKSNNRVTSGLIWRLLERFGAEIVTFIVSIVLARLLEPSVYGIVAIITAITAILTVFVDGGFPNALIQKKDSNSADFSTVFWFNLIASFFLYACLFCFAPLIASIYENDLLTPVIRVLGLIIIIAAFKSIQQTYIRKTMQFKKFFFATMFGTIGAAVIGIYMAVNGFGVWALVAQYLFNSLVDTIALWISTKWRPSFVFDSKSFKGLFSYGWKFLASSLLDTGFVELRSFIIGKRYTSEDLAFYNRGRQLPNMIITNVNTSINSVLLPAMSEVQDNVLRVKEMTRRSLKVGSFIVWPAMIGMCVCAEPIILLLLGEKWLFAVPYLQIFCIIYAFYPISTANLNAIKALGRSDVFLVLEIAKKAVGLLIILISMWFGVFWIAIGALVSSVFGQIINSWPNKKLLHYSYLEQIKDIVPYILVSLFMGIIVFSISVLSLPYWVLLSIQVPLGIFVYFALSFMLKLDSFDYCMNSFKNFLNSRKKERHTL